MANEEDAQERIKPVIDCSIRAAKKAQRPTKIGLEQESYKSPNHKKSSKDKKKKSSFSVDLNAKKSSIKSSSMPVRTNKKTGGAPGQARPKGGKSAKR